VAFIPPYTQVILTLHECLRIFTDESNVFTHNLWKGKPLYCSLICSPPLNRKKHMFRSEIRYRICGNCVFPKHRFYYCKSTFMLKSNNSFLGAQLDRILNACITFCTANILTFLWLNSSRLKTKSIEMNSFPI